ncbi:MAG TPA: FAD-dependent oxidoreductase [Ktedonosporobacter sp.]|nr:FAD-dependent oxidoreductase [Ktedonosporobacter sp.]
MNQAHVQQGDAADIVIIGNGITGMTAALTARRLEPSASVAIITTQSYPTINTPALKQYMVRAIEREQLLSFSPGIERENTLTIMRRLVTAIDSQQQRLTLEGGMSYRYGKLLLATGSRPNGLSRTLPGYDLDGVVVLHRLENYLDLTRRLHSLNGAEKHAVVVGGGLHAAEVALGLTEAGVETHWLLRGNTFLPRLLDQRAASLLLKYLRESGLHIHFNTEIVEVCGKIGVVEKVITNQKGPIAAHLVVVCTGTQASLELADSCDQPIKYQQGILVNDLLQTNVEHIFAAGDVAAIRNTLTGSTEPRAQWYASEMQGRLVGAMLAGHEEEAAEHALGVPWHATRLGHFHLLMVGTPLFQEAEALLNFPDGGYRRVTVRNNRLIGYLSLGLSADDGLGIKRLIDEETPIEDLEQTLLKGTFQGETYFYQRSLTSLLGIPIAGRSDGHLHPALSGVDPHQEEASLLNMTPADSVNRTSIEHEVSACIGCNACLLSCPALFEPILIEDLNVQTMGEAPLTPAVRRFALECTQCRACEHVCPVGLHRDAMMMNLKVRLLWEETSPTRKGL